eukprot:scaffold78429_cov52-Phaeocystis_antarctica.AAC.1
MQDMNVLNFAGRAPKSPMTRLPIRADPTPNRALRDVIEQWARDVVLAALPPPPPLPTVTSSDSAAEQAAEPGG